MIRYILDKQVECDEEIAAVLDEYYGFYQGKDEPMRVFPIVASLISGISGTDYLSPKMLVPNRLTINSYARMREAAIPTVIPYPIDTITIPHSIDSKFFYKLAEKGAFYDGAQVAPIDGFISSFGTVNTLGEMEMYSYAGQEGYVLSCVSINIPIFLLCEAVADTLPASALIESMDYASQYPFVVKVVNEIKARLTQ